MRVRDRVRQEIKYLQLGRYQADIKGYGKLRVGTRERQRDRETWNTRESETDRERETERETERGSKSTTGTRVRSQVYSSHSPQ